MGGGALSAVWHSHAGLKRITSEENWSVAEERGKWEEWRRKRLKITWNVSIQVQGILEATKGRIHVSVYFFFSFRAFMKMMQGESCRSQKGK